MQCDLSVTRREETRFLQLHEISDCQEMQFRTPVNYEGASGIKNVMCFDCGGGYNSVCACQNL